MITLQTSIKDKKWIVYKKGDEVVATLSAKIRGYDCVWTLRYVSNGKVEAIFYSPYSMRNAIERADNLLQENIGKFTIRHGEDVEKIMAA